VTFRNLAVFCLIASSLAAPARSDGPKITLRNVEIVSAESRPMAGSGVVLVWWSFVGLVVVPTKFFMIYGGGEPLPGKGDRCTITYHVGTRSNGLGMDPGEKAAARVVDDLDCSKPAAQS